MEKTSAALELEIQELLIKNGDVDRVADELIVKYESASLSEEQLETFSAFFLNCGLTATLSEFLSRRLKDAKVLPWGHFAQAVLTSHQFLEKEIKQALIDGANVNLRLSQLARSHLLDDLEPELKVQREKRRNLFAERYQLRRKEMWDQFELMRSQNLVDHEEEWLRKILMHYPGDSEATQALKDMRERVALEFMNKRYQNDQRKNKIFHHPPKDPDQEKVLQILVSSMKEQFTQSADSEVIKDFLISLLSLDEAEAALQLISNVPSSPSFDWLKAEVLLQARHFVELLAFLSYLEGKYSQDPETHFAVMYLRAQALWGLEKRFEAIEILENLTMVRPQYRSAATLLDEWRGDHL